MSSPAPPTPLLAQVAPHANEVSLLPSAKPLSGLGRTCSAPVILGSCVPQKASAWKVSSVHSSGKTFTKAGTPVDTQTTPKVGLQGIAEEEEAAAEDAPSYDEQEATQQEATQQETAVLLLASGYYHDQTAQATPVLPVVAQSPAPVPHVATPAPYDVPTPQSTSGDTDTDTATAYETASEGHTEDDGDSDDMDEDEEEDRLYSVVEEDGRFILPQGFVPAVVNSMGFFGWHCARGSDRPHIAFVCKDDSVPTIKSPNEAENEGYVDVWPEMLDLDASLREVYGPHTGWSSNDLDKLCDIQIVLPLPSRPCGDSTPQLQPPQARATYDADQHQTPVHGVYDLPPSSSPPASSPVIEPYSPGRSAVPLYAMPQPWIPRSMYSELENAVPAMPAMPGGFYSRSAGSSPGHDAYDRESTPENQHLPSSLPSSPRRHQARVAVAPRYNPYPAAQITPVYTSSSSSSSNIYQPLRDPSLYANQPVAGPSSVALAGPSHVPSNSLGLVVRAPGRRCKHNCGPECTGDEPAMSANGMYGMQQSLVPSNAQMNGMGFNNIMAMSYNGLGAGAMLQAPTGVQIPQIPGGYQGLDAFLPTPNFAAALPPMPTSSLVDSHGVVPMMYPVQQQNLASLSNLASAMNNRAIQQALLAEQALSIPGAYPQYSEQALVMGTASNQQQTFNQQQFQAAGFQPQNNTFMNLMTPFGM